ncbi:thioesterase II family protein [Streptomyces sp. NPDC014870]|uniref:thioesterase II family protein n=1 Tax=Streptomyces sp. NPDC014870 TaxID=3364925 RepID=UPI0036F78F66
MDIQHAHTRLWLRRFTPVPDAAPTLVCFPHAGGAASAYTALSRTLAPDVEVLALQYPGRQDRRLEPPAESIDALADAVVAALGPELPADCAFFGHSMGAALAFEVARRYERPAGGSGPVRLFVSGRRAPSVRGEGGTRPPDDAEILARVRQLSGTDEALLADEDMMALLLPTLRADYRAVAGHYAPPEARVGCPVTVLVGDADPVTSVEDAAAWRTHSTAPVDVRVFPGGHFYLDARRDAVAGVIREALAVRPAATAPDRTR